MNITILTKNIYLMVGFEYLYSQLNFNFNVCVIDLTSYNNLILIRESLEYNKITEDHKIILLGNNDICSRIFSELGVSLCNMSLTQLQTSMKYGCTLSKVLEYIDIYLELRFLTKKQQYLVKAVYESKSFRAAAYRLNMNQKTLYHKVRKITSKINLRSRNELFIFLTRNLVYYQ